MVGTRLAVTTLSVFSVTPARTWFLNPSSAAMPSGAATLNLLGISRDPGGQIGRRQTWAKATYNGANGDSGPTSPKVGGVESCSIVPSAPGDDVCYEGARPNNVEPPKGVAVEELEHPALLEIKPSSAGPTVWSEFSALAAETGAINLGQGFPNWAPPDFVVAAAHDALACGFHQYTRTPGHPRLVKLLADRYSKHFGREINPFKEVAITIGASEALYVTFQAILSPGDEVVLLEPFFDLYLGQIRLAGGVPRQAPLRVEDREWRLDTDALRRTISPRTRAIVVNTPHNPTGKVFSRKELESIADVVRENPRVLVISDDVYKDMVYGEVESLEEGYGVLTDQAVEAAEASGHKFVAVEEKVGGHPFPSKGHIYFSTLRGMSDRTISISSAGKTFSVTGWQVGWVLGPQRVIREIQIMLPYMQFCVATPFQEAMCNVLVEAERSYEGYTNYYEWLRQQYSGKQKRLERALTAAGIESLQGQGGFFLIGDVNGIKVPEEYLKASTPAMPVMTHDWAFCRWLAIEYGLVAIPTSPFFSAASRAKGLGSGLVRFCFCKTDETLEAAAEVLLKMASEQPKKQALNMVENFEVSS